MFPTRSSPLLLLIVFVAALTGLAGLTTRGLQNWDEGVYYTEARFVYQASRGALYYSLGKLFPRAGYPDVETIRHSVTSLAPSMGRPLNALVNAIALTLLGDHLWVPRAARRAGRPRLRLSRLPGGSAAGR